MKRYQMVLDMRGSLRDMGIAVRNMALLNDTKAMEPEWKRLLAQKAIYITNREKLARMMDDATPAARQAFDKSLSAEKATLDSLEQAGRLGLENKSQEATAYLLTVTRPAQRTLLDALNTLSTIQSEEGQKAVVMSSDSSARTGFTLMVLAGISILLALATCLFTVRTLMRQLGGEPAQAQVLAAAIASGDLTTTVALRRGDTQSLLASLDSMQTNLRELSPASKNLQALLRWRRMRFPVAIASCLRALKSRRRHCRKRLPAWSSLPPR